MNWDVGHRHRGSEVGPRVCPHRVIDPKIGEKVLCHFHVFKMHELVSQLAHLQRHGQESKIGFLRVLFMHVYSLKLFHNSVFIISL